MSSLMAGLFGCRDENILNHNTAYFRPSCLGRLLTCLDEVFCAQYELLSQNPGGASGQVAPVPVAKRVLTMTLVPYFDVMLINFHKRVLS